MNTRPERSRKQALAIFLLTLLVGAVAVILVATMTSASYAWIIPVVIGVALLLGGLMLFVTGPRKQH